MYKYNKKRKKKCGCSRGLFCSVKVSLVSVFPLKGSAAKFSDCEETTRRLVPVFICVCVCENTAAEVQVLS